MNTRLVILVLVGLVGFTIGTTLGVASLNDQYLRAQAEGAWERWVRMPYSQRVAYVETFNEVIRMESSSALFEQARYLDSLPPKRFRAYQLIQDSCQRVLAQMPADRAARVRGLPPSARAALLFRALEQENPAAIETLRQAFGD